MKITEDAHRDIIEAYTVDLWPLQEIADVLHVSRTSVQRFLKKQGIDTSKHQITVSCATCGANLQRTRKRVRKQRNHFCGLDCYHSFLDAGRNPSRTSRMGQRLAREVVSKLFDLQPEHIVHHKDRNQFNNNPSNLMVFKNQGDHIKHHHSERDRHINRLTEPNKHRAAKERYPDAPGWKQYYNAPVEPLWDGGA